MSAVPPADAPDTLRIIVVGHTNTGKTSLIRTLARNPRFGEVSPSPATTRRIEALPLVESESGEVVLYDSPGLERASELADVLEARESSRHRRAEALEALLADPIAEERFEQEARVLEQARRCDAILYVVDAREPLLGKYLDEIEIISRCARPLLPVLNFTAQPERRTREWVERLRALGRQVVVELDAFAYDWPAEHRFYLALRSMLPSHERLIDDLIERRREDADWQARAALRRIAETVVDLAAYQVEAPAEDAEAQQRLIEEMQRKVREAETACTRDVLRIYNYDLGVLELPKEVRLDGRWQADPFSADSLARHAVKVSGPAAAGAGTGLVVDALSGGLTLGAGVVAGTLAGAGYGLRSWLRRNWKQVMESKRVLAVSDAVIQAIAGRNAALLKALWSRGHASELPIRVDDPAAARRIGRHVAGAVLDARDRPSWSRLAGDAAARPSARREAAAARLARGLHEVLARGGGEPSGARR
jgi:hypothetical protein